MGKRLGCKNCWQVETSYHILPELAKALVKNTDIVAEQCIDVNLRLRKHAEFMFDFLERKHKAMRDALILPYLDLAEKFAVKHTNLHRTEDKAQAITEELVADAEARSIWQQMDSDERLAMIYAVKAL